MAMNPAALTAALADEATRREAVVVYSVIGGYLAPSFDEIAAICRKASVPLIVDAAHGHYLPALLAHEEVDLAYSFYATKILPAGEGGLVTTASADTFAWVRRFLMYDRFENQLEVGLNLRAGELGAMLVHRLMTDPAVVSHFRDDRVTIAESYRAECERAGFAYLDPRGAKQYNGYKFVVTEPLERVRARGGLLVAHEPTSGVFHTDVLGRPSTLAHWCPPTYPSLRGGR